jgi:hypothetical protein
MGALSLVACGGETGDAEDDSATDSVVPAEWRSYCMATFTRDYEVVDAFGYTEFTARAGEEYLLADYGEFSGDRASLFYLSPDGPYDFEVQSPSGAQGFPFTSNCTFGSVTDHYAVFRDVSVYAEEALANRLCDLTSGRVLPRTSTSSGFSTSTFTFSGPATYELFLNAFSAECGGASSGFISVPQVEVFGTRTWLVPVRQIVGPN